MLSLLLIACTEAPSESSPNPVSASNAETARYEFVVRNATRETGPARIAAVEGQTIELIVESDQADELHVHGYDLHAEFPADTKASLGMTLTKAGRFEVELHESEMLLTVLEVQPR